MWPREYSMPQPSLLPRAVLHSILAAVREIPHPKPLTNSRFNTLLKVYQPYKKGDHTKRRELVLDLPCILWNELSYPSSAAKQMLAY
jgi:hypothetical protein